MLLSSRGQASAEYVGVLAVVTVVLGVLTAVGAPWLPGTVVERLEHAVCIVGLDVCDVAQARAEGLPPCVTSSEDRTRGTTLLIGVVDTGGSDRLVVEVRSDGSYLVTASHETRLGARAGVGFDVRGLAELGADVRAGGAFGSGTTLEVPDAAALRALLGPALRDPSAARRLVREIDDRYPPERVTRYRQLDARAGLEATAELLGGTGAPSDGAPAGARGGLPGAASFETGGGPAVAVGVRTRGEVRTYYYDVQARADGPLADLLPATGGRLAAAWEAADPPVLTVTTAAGGDRYERVTEARIVLASAADRRLARRWLLSPSGLADPAGRALAARLRASAIVQRLTYARQEVDEGAWGAEAKLGAGAGIDHLASVTRRQLIDAKLLDRPGRRLDCLTSRPGVSASA